MVNQYFILKVRKDLSPLCQASRAKISRTAEILTQVALTGFGQQGHVTVSKDTVTCQQSDVSFVTRFAA